MLRKKKLERETIELEKSPELVILIAYVDAKSHHPRLHLFFETSVPDEPHPASHLNLHPVVVVREETPQSHFSLQGTTLAVRLDSNTQLKGLIEKSV